MDFLTKSFHSYHIYKNTLVSKLGFAPMPEMGSISRLQNKRSSYKLRLLAVMNVYQFLQTT